MPTHLAFLRAINLGARRKFPRDAIRAAVESTGATGVETYTNTGNVRLTTSLRSRARVRQVLEAAFLADRGFEVPTVVFSPAELREVAEQAVELAAGQAALERHYVYLLDEEQPTEAARAIEARTVEGSRAFVGGRACHVLIGSAHQPGTVDALRIEGLLRGTWTARTARVVGAVVEKWC